MPVDNLNLVYSCLALAGLAAWGWMIWRWRKGTPPFAYRERDDVAPDLLCVVASILVWVLASSVVPHYLTATPESPLHIVRVECAKGSVVIAGISLILFAAGGFRPRELGVTLQNWRTDLWDGMLGCLAAFLPVLIVLKATESLRSKETLHQLLKVLLENPQPTTIAWMIFAVVIIAPLTEELLFRVVLQGALTKQAGPRLAIPLVAAAFAAVHNWPDSLPLVPLALVLGYIYHRRHSYLAVVLVHALFNGVNLGLALMTAGDAPAGS